MYGEHVWVTVGEEVEARVWVWCTPDSSPKAKKAAAIAKLTRALAEMQISSGYKSVKE